MEGSAVTVRGWQTVRQLELVRPDSVINKQTAALCSNIFDTVVLLSYYKSNVVNNVCLVQRQYETEEV